VIAPNTIANWIYLGASPHNLQQTIKRRQVMKTHAHRKILAVAAAVMLGLATTGGAALARSGGFGGDHIGGGFRGGGPYLGDTTSTPSPIFNPSSGYTVPTSPEAPVSPASPGSIFH
jgi:hypothetical protein